MEHPRPLSPAWYLLPFALFAIGWNFGVAWAGHAWDPVEHANISSSTEALQAKGESIAVFTDVVQTDRNIRCFMNDVVRDSKPQRMNPAPVPLPNDNDGTTWTLIAWERYGRDNVAVTCAPADKRVDNAQYAAVAVDGVNTRMRVGNAITWASVAIAIALLLILYRVRRRQLRGQ